MRLTFHFLLLAVGLCPLAHAQESTCIQAVLPELQKSGGRLTSEVRSAYLGWAESRVLEQIHAAGLKIPSDCLDEVRTDPTLRDAMFASMFPPDPSVIQNYARLRRE